MRLGFKSFPHSNIAMRFFHLKISRRFIKNKKYNFMSWMILFVSLNTFDMLFDEVYNIDWSFINRT